MVCEKAEKNMARGALAGATAGAVLGPMGSIVGGLVGAFVGLNTTKKDRMSYREVEQCVIHIF